MYTGHVVSKCAGTKREERIKNMQFSFFIPAAELLACLGTPRYVFLRTLAGPVLKTLKMSITVEHVNNNAILNMNNP